MEQGAPLSWKHQHTDSPTDYYVLGYLTRQFKDLPPAREDIQLEAEGVGERWRGTQGLNHLHIPASLWSNTLPFIIL